MATIFGTYSAPPISDIEELKALTLKMTRQETYKENSEMSREEIGQEETFALVCTPIKFEAFNIDNKIVNEKNIEWKIRIEDKDGRTVLKEKHLHKVKEIKANPKKLEKSGEIYFTIPKEWGKKTIIIIAKLIDQSAEVEARIYIRDHFVAAFNRLDGMGASKFVAKNIIPEDGVYNSGIIGEVLGEINEPLFHNQGLWREGNLFYISVSTNINHSPAYIYVIEKQGDNYNYKETICLQGRDLENYTHPGGIQIANNFLAVGCEKYAPDNSSTCDRSLLVFLDKKSFYKQLTIRKIFDDFYGIYDRELTKEEKKRPKVVADFASATGIVCINGQYLVASRGRNNSVDFYSFDDDNEEEPKHIANKFENVGNFQNLNLFVDEYEESEESEDYEQKKEKNYDIYMIGMESKKIPILTNGSTTNYCYLYKIKWDEKDKISIHTVWIDSQDGQIKEEEGYKNTVLYNEDYASKHDLELAYKNVSRFTTKGFLIRSSKIPSFQWASCIYLEENEYVKDKKGFIKDFVVYAVGSRITRENELHFNSFTELEYK